MINLLGLIEMYNTYNRQTVYHELAGCLLKHFDQLDQLSASDIAELCNVSPSTLQRFFKMMDYPMTVSKLPQILNHTKTSYYYESDYMPPKQMKGDYLSDYIGSLCDNLNQLKDQISQEKIESIVTIMQTASQVIFLGCPVPQEAWRLQVDLVMQGIETNAFLSPNDQFDSIKKMPKGSFIIYFDYFKALSSRYSQAIKAHNDEDYHLLVVSNHLKPAIKGDSYLCFEGNESEQDFIAFNVLMNVIGQTFISQIREK